MWRLRVCTMDQDRELPRWFLEQVEVHARQINVQKPHHHTTKHVCASSVNIYQRSTVLQLARGLLFYDIEIIEFFLLSVFGAARLPPPQHAPITDTFSAISLITIGSELLSISNAAWCDTGFQDFIVVIDVSNHLR